MDYFSYFRFPAVSSSAAAPAADDATTPGSDGPPELLHDDFVPSSALPSHQSQLYHPAPGHSFTKTTIRPRADRRRSLLTTGLGHHDEDVLAQLNSHHGKSHARRGFSTASSASGLSVSTAELTSDDGRHSIGRPTTPSPPTPGSFAHAPPLFIDHPAAVIKHKPSQQSQYHVAGTGQPGTEVSGLAPEAKVEATLGRKRCIMFASTERKEAPTRAPVVQATKTEGKAVVPAIAPPIVARKSCLKFSCPSKQQVTSETSPHPIKAQADKSVALTSRSEVSTIAARQHRGSDDSVTGPRKTWRSQGKTQSRKKQIDAEVMRVHELGGISEGEDPWLSEATDTSRKMLVDSGLVKDKMIRAIGQQIDDEEDADAEDELDTGAAGGNEDSDEDELEDEEARSSAAAVDELDEDEDEDDDDEDSDHSQESDDGNESDNEEGFGSSEDGSESGSLFEFRTPGTTKTAATSIHVSETKPRLHRTASESSSGDHDLSPEERFEFPDRLRRRHVEKLRVPKPHSSRTQLPDSADFVCGTLDEDRPAQQAWLASREQRKRSRASSQVEDLDPSMPVTEIDSDDEDTEAVVGNQDGDHETDLAATITPGVLNQPHGRQSRSPPPQSRLRNRSPPPRSSRRSPVRKSVSTIKDWDFSTHSRAISPRRSQQGVHHHKDPNDPPQPITHTTSLPRRSTPFHFPLAKAAAAPKTAAAIAAAASKTAAMKIEYVRGPGDILAGLEEKKRWQEKKLLQKRAAAAAAHAASQLHLAGLGVQEKKRLIPGIGCMRMKEVALGIRIGGGKRMLSI